MLSFSLEDVRIPLNFYDWKRILLIVPPFQLIPLSKACKVSAKHSNTVLNGCQGVKKKKIFLSY